MTFKGTLDEVRVTDSVLSAKRLDAEYASQRASNAAPFVVFGPTELDHVRYRESPPQSGCAVPL